MAFSRGRLHRVPSRVSSSRQRRRLAAEDGKRQQALNPAKWLKRQTLATAGNPQQCTAKVPRRLPASQPTSPEFALVPGNQRNPSSETARTPFSSSALS
jgi:hypothetical protein